MREVSEARVRVWIYRELMGTLGSKKRELLKSSLNEKKKNGDLEPIERRIWAAMTLYANRRDQREYLKSELKAWEKRTAP